MPNKIKEKMNNRRGFSFVEMLMAVLILLMASAIVAGGIPVAINAYMKIVESANAQLLLSTTLTRLRDELSTATDVTVSSDSKTITFTENAGSESKIYFVTSSDGIPRIYLQEYNDITEESEVKYEHPIVSNAASNKNLYAYYDSVEYNNGVLTFHDLTVKKSSEELATAGLFKIRVLNP